MYILTDSTGTYTVADDGTRTRWSPEMIAAERARVAKAEADRIAAKGHDCWDHVVAGYDDGLSLGDYYTCRLCGDLLQVG